jgi:tripartite-type tricarboxylate transporter receptor subunit TctC
MHLRRLIAAALFALLTIPGQAAEQFPAREITLVVPLTPGTTIDILARLYADKLGKLLGQQIVVMNRPGAGGIVGAESVATAAPDGYTLLFGNSGHSILGLLNKNLAFDPIKDFAGAAMIGAAPAIVVVPRSASPISMHSSRSPRQNRDSSTTVRPVSARRPILPARISPRGLTSKLSTCPIR